MPGAVGINLEDKDPVTRQLFERADAAARIKAAAASGMWINARADLFIVTPKEQHDASSCRCGAGSGKGLCRCWRRIACSCPSYTTSALIGRLCEKSPLPVNILVGDGIPGIKSARRIGRGADKSRAWALGQRRWMISPPGHERPWRSSVSQMLGTKAVVNNVLPDFVPFPDHADFTCRKLVNPNSLFTLFLHSKAQSATKPGPPIGA